LQDEDADKLKRLCAWRSKDVSASHTQGPTGGKGARACYCSLKMQYRGNHPHSNDDDLHVALMSSGLDVPISDALLSILIKCLIVWFEVRGSLNLEVRKHTYAIMYTYMCISESAGTAYQQALAPGCAHALLVSWILERAAPDMFR
jgi:hypothetical protein